MKTVLLVGAHRSRTDESGARRRSFFAMTIAFGIAGPIGRGDLPGLCARVCALLERSGADIAFCDVSGVDSDAVTVEALARLQLAARRHGCRIRLCNASKELRDLVAFMGLRDVLPA